MSRDRMTPAEFNAAVEALIADGRWAGLTADTMAALLTAQAAMLKTT